MKKLLLLLLLTGTLSVSQGQVTITRSDIGDIGDKLYYAIRDTFSTTIPVGNAGTGQTWNFSTITPTLNDSALFLDPTLDPNAPAAANLSITIDGTTDYIFIDSTKMEVINENAQSGLEIRYKWLVFPMVYGTAYEDSADVDVKGKGADFGAGIFDSIWIQVKGESYSSCDGAGTLTTPTQSYSALRTKTTTYNNIQILIKVTPLDTSWTNLITQIDTEYVYRWYADNEKLYVAEAYTDINGNINYFSYTTDSVVTITGMQTSVETRIAEMYPIPARTHVIVSTTNNESFTYQVYDLSGRSKQYGSGNRGKALIDVSELSNGVYVCVITQNGTQMKKRIVVSH